MILVSRLLVAVVFWSTQCLAVGSSGNNSCTQEFMDIVEAKEGCLFNGDELSCWRLSLYPLAAVGGGLVAMYAGKLGTQLQRQNGENVAKLKRIISEVDQAKYATRRALFLRVQEENTAARVASNGKYKTMLDLSHARWGPQTDADNLSARINSYEDGQSDLRKRYDEKMREVNQIDAMNEGAKDSANAALRAKAASLKPGYLKAALADLYSGTQSANRLLSENLKAIVSPELAAAKAPSVQPLNGAPKLERADPRAELEAQNVVNRINGSTIKDIDINNVWEVVRAHDIRVAKRITGGAVMGLATAGLIDGFGNILQNVDLMRCAGPLGLNAKDISFLRGLTPIESPKTDSKMNSDGTGDCSLIKLRNAGDTFFQNALIPSANPEAICKIAKNQDARLTGLFGEDWNPKVTCDHIQDSSFEISGKGNDQRITYSRPNGDKVSIPIIPGAEWGNLNIATITNESKGNDHSRKETTTFRSALNYSRVSSIPDKEPWRKFLGSACVKSQGSLAINDCDLRVVMTRARFALIMQKSLCGKPDQYRAPGRADFDKSAFPASR